MKLVVGKGEEANVASFQRRRRLRKGAQGQTVMGFLVPPGCRVERRADMHEFLDNRPDCVPKLTLQSSYYHYKSYLPM